MKLMLILVSGVGSLFWLPIEQYQKDGRIIRGLQRGANAFAISTAAALIELTSKVVCTIQASLLAFYIYFPQ